ncbi:MAG: hypothetical protein IPH07_17290 [Deltaproteobacteria bacterium]|nr:hypothetical protein [Deltaproteobacteria bacterium]MBK8239517.1 hypothetical protein [Deltaproteobacteria bacterium]MBK8719319.1 hypothetical protein [Deltaproteobacteria bacterium]
MKAEVHMNDADFLAKMMRLYPDFLREQRGRLLDPSHVPQPLRRYLPLAELWGEADDTERAKLVERAPQSAKDHLVETIALIDDLLDAWLAGPEAESAHPTAEYIAFSAMRMAADFV